MVGDEIYKVSEWEWLKTQLHIAALRSRGNYVNKLYRFDDDNRLIICSIYWKYSKEDVTRKVSRQEHLEVYRGWLKAEDKLLNKIIQTLSNMREAFDLKERFVLEMMQENPGMSPNLICRIQGEQVEWGHGH